MKKMIFVMAGLIMMTVISAQSLDEIVKKYTEANKLDKVANLKRLKSLLICLLWEWKCLW